MRLSRRLLWWNGAGGGLPHAVIRHGSAGGLPSFIWMWPAAGWI